MKIVTNNVPRDLLSAHELDPALREKEFDYISEGEWFEDCHNRFFQYKGVWYDVNEFSVNTTHPQLPLDKWDGIQTDSFFSGIVIKYCDDFEGVIVGRVLI